MKLASVIVSERLDSISPNSELNVGFPAESHIVTVPLSKKIHSNIENKRLDLFLFFLCLSYL